MPKGIPSTSTCPVTENGVICGAHADSHGMCKKHWTRFTRHGDPTIRKMMWGDALGRFWEKVDKNGPVAKNNPEFGRCWLWTAARNRSGYGRIGVGSRVLLAHRFAYEEFVGPIPVGLQLDHFACDNPSCVNPSHLRPVTHRENTLRSDSMAANYIARTHCHRGHEFTPGNTIIRADGYRSCRQCKLDKRRKGIRPETYGLTGPLPRDGGGRRI